MGKFPNIRDDWLTDIQNNVYKEVLSANYRPPYSIKIDEEIITKIQNIENNKKFPIESNRSITIEPSTIIPINPRYDNECIESPLGKFRKK